MRRWMMRALCLVVLGLSLFAGYQFYKQRNDGFSVERISSSFENSLDWDISVTARQLYTANEILRQPFYYLNHGFQCYAFVSQDGKYVLKFLRHQRLCPPVLLQWLPQVGFIKDLKEKKSQERAKRANALFRSLKLAFTDVPQETGVVFVHLNKTTGMHPQVTIHDKSGAAYTIMLDDKEFALQERASYIKPTIEALMKEGSVQRAKERIDELFILLVRCAERGVCDEDRALIHKDNIGYLPDRAIYIDAGRLVKRSQLVNRAYMTRDLQRLNPLYKWLLKHYPVLAEHFQSVKKSTLESIQP